MATRTRYVNTSSTAGSQDGTTNTPGNSGTAAYESVQAAEGSEQADLVAAGDTLVIICDPAGGADSGNQVSFSGWTTGASNDITVRAASGSEHDGVSRENSGTGYQIKTTGKVIDIFEDYITFEDMEFTINGNAIGIDFSTLTATTNLIKFARCIFSKTDTSTGSYMLSSGNADLNLVLENCQEIGRTGRGFDLRTSASVVIDHCGLLVDNTIGVLLDGSALVTNSWFFNNGGAAIHSSSSTPNASSTHNACNDTSMTSESWPGTLYESLTEANEITAVGTNYADPVTADASIKSDGTKTFDDAGTGSLADDITNTAREGTPDVGAYELIGGAAPVRLGQLMMMGVGT